MTDPALTDEDFIDMALDACLRQGVRPWSLTDAEADEWFQELERILDERTAA